MKHALPGHICRRSAVEGLRCWACVSLSAAEQGLSSSVTVWQQAKAGLSVEAIALLLCEEAQARAR